MSASTNPRPILAKVITHDGKETGQSVSLKPTNSMFRARKQRPRVHWRGSPWLLETWGDGWALRLNPPADVSPATDDSLSTP